MITFYFLRNCWPSPVISPLGVG